MNVVLYGATGKSGVVILKELVDRGHTVVAATRKPEKVAKLSHVSTVQDDLTDVAVTKRVIEGAEAVVSAIGPPPDNTDALLAPSELLVKAIEQAGGPRLLVVGGAGSLFVAPGVTLHHSGYLPEAYMAISESHGKLLEYLKQSSIDWTYFSPAGFFEPGERTGTFRLGKDDLIADATGKSSISFEDYAIALVDELEKPQNHKARFTIGY